MPVAPTYPGVYVEELPSGVHTIVGVSTSVTAFLGNFSMGPTNTPTRIFSVADLERTFGPLTSDSEAGYAVRQFFAAGGSEAWIVRVAGLANGKSAADASADVPDGADTTVLKATAASEGSWGDQLRLAVDYAAPATGSSFNLTVTRVAPGDPPEVVATETYRGLTLTPGDATYAVDVVNGSSGLVLLALPDPANPPATRPAQTGTISGDVSGVDLSSLARKDLGTLTLESAAPVDLAALAADLQTKLRALDPALAAATAAIDGSGHLLEAGSGTASKVLWFGGELAQILGLTTSEAAPDVSAVDLTKLGGKELQVTVGAGAMTVDAGKDLGVVHLDAAPVDFAALADAIQTKLRALQDGSGAAVVPSATATVAAEDGKQLLTIASGTPDHTLWFTGELAGILGLDSTDDPPDVSGVDLTALNGKEMEAWLGTRVGSVEVKRTPSSVTELASMLQAQLGVVQVGVLQGPGAQRKLRITTATGEAGSKVVFRDVEGKLATDLALTAAAGATTNPQQYALDGGLDGGPPDDGALIGDPLMPKKGIPSLDDVEFNILCLPDVMRLDDAAAAAVISAATTYCRARLAFLIVDPPQQLTPAGQQGKRDSLVGIQDWLNASSTLRSSYAALYFPRPRIPDPLNGSRPRSVAASGTIAGLYARTDADRGVWKAPAGTAATLTNVTALTYRLTDAENGVLNPLAINCLRTFPIYGNVCWGARTLDGADAIASEWKYVSVRRTALYIEGSLYRGTQWVVFEPNDEPLWAQIRLNVGAFMNDLFRKGAFEGSTPAKAYLVKCDADTTTQSDIDAGVVNILVGFAPLEPAEFVILEIQQLAGQIPT